MEEGGNLARTIPTSNPVLISEIKKKNQNPKLSNSDLNSRSAEKR